MKKIWQTMKKLFHETKYFGLKTQIRHFVKWIKKVFDYAIILWNDYDYDYSSILRLLQYKLQRQKKFFESDKSFGDQTENIQDLNKANALLQIVIDEEDKSYADQLRSVHNSKWGKTNIIWMPYFEGVLDEPKYYSMELEYDNKSLTDVEKEQERKEYTEMYQLIKEDKDNKKKELFQLLSDKIEYWWD